MWSIRQRYLYSSRDFELVSPLLLLAGACHTPIIVLDTTLIVVRGDVECEKRLLRFSQFQLSRLFVFAHLSGYFAYNMRQTHYKWISKNCTTIKKNETRFPHKLIASTKLRSMPVVSVDTYHIHSHAVRRCCAELLASDLCCCCCGAMPCHADHA